jgi:hypothetical protein
MVGRKFWNSCHSSEFFVQLRQVCTRENILCALYKRRQSENNAVTQFFDLVEMNSFQLVFSFCVNPFITSGDVVLSKQNALDELMVRYDRISMAFKELWKKPTSDLKDLLPTLDELPPEPSENLSLHGSIDCIPPLFF